MQLSGRVSISHCHGFRMFWFVLQFLPGHLLNNVYQRKIFVPLGSLLLVFDGCIATGPGRSTRRARWDRKNRDYQGKPITGMHGIFL